MSLYAYQPPLRLPDCNIAARPSSKSDTVFSSVVSGVVGQTTCRATLPSVAVDGVLLHARGSAATELKARIENERYIVFMAAGPFIQEVDQAAPRGRGSHGRIAETGTEVEIQPRLALARQARCLRSGTVRRAEIRPWSRGR